jgi:hypothetical protein
VAYIYTHIVNEFARNKPLTMPELYPMRTDTAVFQWLAGARATAIAETTAETETDADLWALRLGVSAYALTVGTLPRLRPPSPGSADKGKGTSTMLETLSGWFEDQIACWLISDSRAGNTSEIKDKVVSKMEWLMQDGPAQDAAMTEFVMMLPPGVEETGFPGPSST